MPSNKKYRQEKLRKLEAKSLQEIVARNQAAEAVTVEMEVGSADPMEYPELKLVEDYSPDDYSPAKYDKEVENDRCTLGKKGDDGLDESVNLEEVSDFNDFKGAAPGKLSKEAIRLQKCIIETATHDVLTMAQAQDLLKVISRSHPGLYPDDLGTLMMGTSLESKLHDQK